MKISIITPIYNAENFINRLVDSVLTQTYKNFELILIDDGSTDKSGAICDEYAARDKRIRVIHNKENGGVSSARQAGLDAAIGEYIIHADSDDWVAPNWLEELTTCAIKTQADMIIYDFYRVSNGVNEHIVQQPKSLSHEQVLRDVISGHLYACCWNKLIRKKTILKNEAAFPKGFNFSEDKCFLVSLLIKPLSVAYLPRPLYFYDVTMNKGSLVRQITLSSMNDGFAMVDYLESKLGEEFYNEIYETKRRLKLRAIESKLYTNTEVNNIYRNLNARFIKDVVLLKRHRIDDYILLLTTLKAMWAAKLLNKTFLFLYKLKTKIKH